MDRAIAVGELQSLFGALNDDVRTGYELLEQHRNLYLARSLVRSQFALIEGVTEKMRDVALASCDDGEVVFTNDEKDILSGRKGVSDNGRNLRNGRSSFLGILTFTMGNYGKVHGVIDYWLDKNNSGWDDFRAALDYRDLITHPKSLEQFELNMEEWDRISRGLGWFDGQLIGLFKECEKADEYWRSKQNIDC